MAADDVEGRMHAKGGGGWNIRVACPGLSYQPSCPLGGAVALSIIALTPLRRSFLSVIEFLVLRIVIDGSNESTHSHTHTE